MTSLIPQSHLEENRKLEGDAYRDLFRIQLTPVGTGAYLQFTADETVVWRSNTWEGVPLKLEGDGLYSDEQRARPQLTIANPAGVFSSQIRQGIVDRAFVTRYRVTRQHIEDNLAIYQVRTWQVARVSNFNRYQVVLELRDLFNGPQWPIPARMFKPPEFPTVKLR